MKATPYLYFRGQCEAALEHYAEAFDAEVIFLIRWEQGAAEEMPIGWQRKVFHATLAVGESILNLADIPGGQGAAFAGFAFVLQIESEAAILRAFEVLKNGGEEILSLRATDWATFYGIVVDRFGVTWKLQVPNPR